VTVAVPERSTELGEAQPSPLQLNWRPPSRPCAALMLFTLFCPHAALHVYDRLSQRWRDQYHDHSAGPRERHAHAGARCPPRVSTAARWAAAWGYRPTRTTGIEPAGWLGDSARPQLGGSCSFPSSWAACYRTGRSAGSVQSLPGVARNLLASWRMAGRGGLCGRLDVPAIIGLWCPAGYYSVG
jgi:hypothetical protein